MGEALPGYMYACVSQPGDIVAFNMRCYHSAWGGQPNRRMCTVVCPLRGRITTSNDFVGWSNDSFHIPLNLGPLIHIRHIWSRYYDNPVGAHFLHFYPQNPLDLWGFYATKCNDRGRGRGDAESAQAAAIQPGKERQQPSHHRDGRLHRQYTSKTIFGFKKIFGFLIQIQSD